MSIRLPSRTPKQEAEEVARANYEQLKVEILRSVAGKPLRRSRQRGHARRHAEPRRLRHQRSANGHTAPTLALHPI